MLHELNLLESLLASYLKHMIAPSFLFFSSGLTTVITLCILQKRVTGMNNIELIFHEHGSGHEQQQGTRVCTVTV